MDLIDFANYGQARDEAKAAFNRIDDDLKEAVCRELMIDQISIIIEKFPVRTQREIIALLTEKFMHKWNINEHRHY